MTANEGNTSVYPWNRGGKSAISTRAYAPYDVALTTTWQFDGLSRLTCAHNEGASGANPADVNLCYDSLSRLLEDSQSFVYSSTPLTRNVTNTAFASYPATEFSFPDIGATAGRRITNTFDLLYRRQQVQETSGGANIALWNFAGPSRVAEVQLGNGLACTWMNNARTNSAVQSAVANPLWGSPSSDRLGYDGAGRPIAKRYLPFSDGSYTSFTPVVGFSTAFDRASNKFYERALHAENRSHLYEPFDSNGLPTGGYDSLDRLRQYQRGTLASTGGFGGNGGGAIAVSGSTTLYIDLPNTDITRSYLLDSLGNWRNTVFTTAVALSAETEVRQHNGLNQITRISQPGRESIRFLTRRTTPTAI